jgi:thiamine kinase-like enzyme
MEKLFRETQLAILPLPELSHIEEFVYDCIGKHIITDAYGILRQRDFSLVARFCMINGQYVIYKKVIAPWDCEAQILSAIDAIHSPNIPAILGIRQGDGWAEILQQDVGRISLRDKNSSQLAERTGALLAQIHQALGDASTVWPDVIPRLDSREKMAACFHANAHKLERLFPEFDKAAVASLILMGGIVAEILGETEMGLQHGDVYGENIMLKYDVEPCFIDWSYFAFVGPKVYDLATLVSGHDKNGSLIHHRQTLISSYTRNAGVSQFHTENLIPAAYRLSRLLFLQWLLARAEMGIMQTTVGPVENLITTVVSEILS